MQQDPGGMKRSHAAVHNFNRSRRSTNERKNQSTDIRVQRVGGETRSLTRSKPLTQTQSVVPGKAENTAAPSLHKQDPGKPKGNQNAHLPTGNVVKNAAFHVIFRQYWKANQEIRDAQPEASAQRKKSDASDPSARQQRGFGKDGSAIETESGGCEVKGRPERLTLDSGDEDEYYTDQKITEWVHKVNSSLFSTGNDETRSSKAAEEQDVAIKIIYAGD